MAIKDDINKLVSNSKKQAVLPTLNQPDSIPAKVGASVLAKSGSGSGSGSGIDSPLTEVSRVTVPFEQFDDFNVSSVIEDVVVKLTMKDSSDRIVIFNFYNPNI